jgi:hypothetical protein
MEVLDDIELGRMMAARAGRQELILANGMLSIEMYASALGALRGIQKNGFTFLDYSAWKVLGATAVTFAFSVWPWLGPWVTVEWARWLCIGSAAAPTLLYVWLAPRFGYPRWCVIHLPYMGVLTIVLFWQIALRTWWRGGVTWRGTFYPLAEIKGGKGRWRDSS